MYHFLLGKGRSVDDYEYTITVTIDGINAGTMRASAQQIRECESYIVTPVRKLMAGEGTYLIRIEERHISSRDNPTADVVYQVEYQYFLHVAQKMRELAPYNNGKTFDHIPDLAWRLWTRDNPAHGSIERNVTSTASTDQIEQGSGGHLLGRMGGFSSLEDEQHGNDPGEEQPLPSSSISLTERLGPANAVTPDDGRQDQMISPLQQSDAMERPDLETCGLSTIFRDENTLEPYFQVKEEPESDYMIVNREEVDAPVLISQSIQTDNIALLETTSVASHLTSIPHALPQTSVINGDAIEICRTKRPAPSDNGDDELKEKELKRWEEKRLRYEKISDDTAIQEKKIDAELTKYKALKNQQRLKDKQEELAKLREEYKSTLAQSPRHFSDGTFSQRKTVSWENGGQEVEVPNRGYFSQGEIPFSPMSMKSPLTFHSGSPPLPSQDPFRIAGPSRSISSLPTPKMREYHERLDRHTK
jgi:hypothetical protein